jgi:hypothetical protein
LKLEKKRFFLKTEKNFERKFCKSKVVYFEHRSLLYIDDKDYKEQGLSSQWIITNEIYCDSNGYSDFVHIKIKHIYYFSSIIHKYIHSFSCILMFLDWSLNIAKNNAYYEKSLT